MQAATIIRSVSQTLPGFAANLPSTSQPTVGPHFAGLRALPLPKAAGRQLPAAYNRASVISANAEKKPRDVAAKAVATAPPPPAPAPVVEETDRLVPRVFKNDEGYWELKKEFQASLNPAEKVGVIRFCLDQVSIAPAGLAWIPMKQ